LILAAAKPEILFIVGFVVTEDEVALAVGRFRFSFAVDDLGRVKPENPPMRATKASTTSTE